MLVEQVTAKLSTIIEPELQKDIATLNMVQDVNVDGKTAQIAISLLSPIYNKEQLERDIKEMVQSIDGINNVEVQFSVEIPVNPRTYGKMNLQIKNLLAVSSGKGGVGKSTVATNLAVALASEGARVGLLDADITGPNLPLMMGLDGKRPMTGEKLIPIEAHGVKVMSMGFLLDPNRAVIWRGPMIHQAIQQLFTDVDWGELDYMIVDLPPGTGDAQLTLAQSIPVSGVLIVTQPQQVAIGDALRGMAMFQEVKVPVMGVVENMSGELFGKGGGETLAKNQSVPFLGSIPLQPDVRVGGDTGKPVIVTSPDSDASTAIKEMAGRVAIRLADSASDQGNQAIPIRMLD